MTRPARVRAAALALIAGALLALLPAAVSASVSPSALRCLAPTDAAGLDAQLAGVGSPLAGQGGAFVREATAVGVDPRFLVAVAAHETVLETYAPARAIHNPFGLGPGIEFPDEAAAIASAAGTLRRIYLSEGRVTIPDIGAKWAPIGADNDPGSLNGYWPGGVGAYYRALGGDPDRPVLLSAQAAAPACAPIALAPVDVAGRPAVVTAWGGRIPGTDGPAMHQGGDPATGVPATLPAFHFPLAPPDGVGVRYSDSFAQSGPGLGCYGRSWACTVTLESAPGVLAVASVAGRLVPAAAQDQAAGIAFWIAAPGGDRVGYGGLSSYVDGVRAGVAVVPGQALGRSTGRLPVTWTRGGLPLNPYPLLAATRPPDA